MPNEAGQVVFKVDGSVFQARHTLVLRAARNTVLFGITMLTDDTIQKLQFILNKEIQPVLAAREEIVEAINRHYGQTETESVDSMLQEFTDTQIDFTETDTSRPNSGYTGFSAVLGSATVDNFMLEQ